MEWGLNMFLTGNGRGGKVVLIHVFSSLDGGATKHML